MATRIQLRRDTAANWADANPALAVGEAGFDVTNNQLRIGDGERNWNALTPLDGSNIDLSIYATKSALTSESQARANGDAALQEQIDNIEGADLTGYATTEDLQAEANARTTADASLDARITALEARPVGIQHAPADDDQWVSRNGEWDRLDVTAPMTLEFEYRGKEWWASPTDGECYAHEQDSQLFFASKDDNGLPANAIFDQLIKPGVSLLISKSTDRSKWVHFTATTEPTQQTWGRNFGVDLNSKGKDFKKGDVVTIQFNIQPPVDVGAELTALKRQISSLKGEITKLKKANG